MTAGLIELVPLLMVGFFCYGFGFGGTIPLSEFTWAGYFGRRYIGAIRGASNPPTLLMQAVSPVLVGVWFDLTGGYHWSFVAIIASFFVAASLIATSKAPVD